MLLQSILSGSLASISLAESRLLLGHQRSDSELLLLALLLLLEVLGGRLQHLVHPDDVQSAHDCRLRLAAADVPAAGTQEDVMAVRAGAHEATAKTNGAHVLLGVQRSGAHEAAVQLEVLAQVGVAQTFFAGLRVDGAHGHAVQLAARVGRLGPAGDKARAARALEQTLGGQFVGLGQTHGTDEAAEAHGLAQNKNGEVVGLGGGIKTGVAHGHHHRDHLTLSSGGIGRP